EETLRHLTASLGPHDRIAVYAFGRGTLVERSLTHDTSGLALRTNPDVSATHIENALRTVVERIPPGVNSRILLLSDGIETAGRAENVVAELVERSIPVDVVPVSAYPDAEVAVEHLLAPAI